MMMMMMMMGLKALRMTLCCKQVGAHHSFSLIASYGIAVNVMAAVLSPPLKAVVDKADRLVATVVVTMAQSICMACGATCFVALVYTDLGTYICCERLVGHDLT